MAVRYCSCGFWVAQHRPRILPKTVHPLDNSAFGWTEFLSGVIKQNYCFWLFRSSCALKKLSRLAKSSLSKYASAQADRTVDADLTPLRWIYSSNSSLALKLKVN